MNSPPPPSKGGDQKSEHVIYGHHNNSVNWHPALKSEIIVMNLSKSDEVKHESLEDKTELGIKSDVILILDSQQIH